MISLFQSVELLRAIQKEALESKKSYRAGSVLTRILPWGVPGSPLLRNRGPVRTLGGQSYSKWSVT